MDVLERPWQIIEGDMFDALESVADGSVQMVLTDPPYMVGSVSARKKEDIGPWGDLMNGARFFCDVLRVIRKKLSGDGCAWVFGNWRGLPSLYKAACDAHWLPGGCMVWDKRWPGSGYLMRSSWELAMLFAMEGYERKTTAFLDVQYCPVIPAQHRVHPAQKPADLLRRMIEFGTKPGDVVLDPFCGSGSTGCAAIQSGRRFIGIEIDPEFCNVARGRLSGQYEQPRISFDVEEGNGE